MCPLHRHLQRQDSAKPPIVLPRIHHSHEASLAVGSFFINFTALNRLQRRRRRGHVHRHRALRPRAAGCQKYDASKILKSSSRCWPDLYDDAPCSMTLRQLSRWPSESKMRVAMRPGIMANHAPFHSQATPQSNSYTRSSSPPGSLLLRVRVITGLGIRSRRLHHA